MSWNPQVLRRSRCSSWGGKLGLATAIVAGCISPLAAQEAPRPADAPPQSTVGGFRAIGRQLPERPPLPSTGDRGIGGFVQELNNHQADADIEVVLGRPRLITLRQPLGEGDQTAQISIGDPSVADVAIVNAKQLRVTGVRAGITDIVVTTPKDETYVFRVFVVYDLDVLRAQLKAVFPDASLRLGQIREHIVVEGEARDAPQVARILQVVRAYLASMTALQASSSSATGGAPTGQSGPTGGEAAPPSGDAPGGGEEEGGAAGGAPEGGIGGSTVSGTVAGPQLINLIRVPGSNQVMLKVRVAELNRTALRQVGLRFSVGYGDNGNVFNSLIGPNSGTGTVITGTFGAPNINYFLTAFKRNNVLKILAEPNLVTLSGHQASFLAGGEFPVPVPQPGGAGTTITIQYREFGVRLGFLPFVLDNERIRLTVVPEVSNLDPANGTTIGGGVVPGLNTRRTETTVELRQAQSLAIAGLLTVQMDSTTERVPVMGDLPYIGSMFRNNTKNRVEKELLIVITPYLVEPMNSDQVPLSPGDELFEPNELEFFLLGRIESRVGRDHRSPVKWDDPLDLVRIMNLERRQAQGKVGFSQ